MGIQDSNIVKEQYKNAENLQTRISIHDKYSVNKKGFGNWIFEQYVIEDKYNILELGCGNGDMWSNHIKELPKDSILTLTDFSEGMLLEAKNNILKKNNIIQHDSILFQQVDIQNIPFSDNSFDVIIANMMLYHVPDLDKALFEVKRVLKSDGTFYCATYGENGIAEHIQDLLKDYGVKKNLNKVFTLQNGEDILARYFSSIHKSNYEDHLEVTDTEDLVDYVFSLTSMIDFNKISKEELRVILDKEKIDGKIIIPKEYGMFIVKK